MTQAPVNPPTNTRLQDQPSIALAVSGLVKRYGEHEVVRDVSFKIPTGSVVGLLGPNGAGKTTVMKCILGLVSITQGSVSVLGSSPGDRDWHTKLQRVGAMIEAPPIYMNMSARHNLEYQRRAVGFKDNEAPITELLELVDLAGRADDKPSGFSLGMKQRLGIAISLINDPELVVLDEPANGLDPQGIVEIRELLQRLPERGVTVLVSSHQLSEVQQACDHLLILNDGAVIESGSTDEIIQRNNTAHLSLSFEDGLSASSAQATLAQSGIESTILTPQTLGVSSQYPGSEINRRLAQADIFASSIKVETSSLEDTFLNLTSTH